LCFYLLIHTFCFKLILVICSFLLAQKRTKKSSRSLGLRLPCAARKESALRKVAKAPPQSVTSLYSAARLREMALKKIAASTNFFLICFFLQPSAFSLQPSTTSLLSLSFTLETLAP